MRSMTGFGVARADLPDGQLTVQLAAVNHRHLQIQLRGDLNDLALEDLVREAIRQRCTRGHVTAQVNVARDAGADWDRATLAATWRNLADLARELGAPPPRLEILLGLTRRGQTNTAIDAALLRAVTTQAIDDLEGMRLTEGAHLSRVLTDLQTDLDAVVAALDAGARQRLPTYQERLVQRVRDAIGNIGGADEAAVLRECALQSDRMDIAEELARLQSHREQFTALLDPLAADAVGRTLEFLLQEMGREINTTGSKANDAELVQLAVQGKAIVEQMREQVANVL